jgi:hypothetical protein
MPPPEYRREPGLIAFYAAAGPDLWIKARNFGGSRIPEICKNTPLYDKLIPGRPPTMKTLAPGIAPGFSLTLKRRRI